MVFNWKQFHKDLDMAMAIYLQETSKLLSDTSVMDFAEYSHQKTKGKENGNL